MISPTRPASEIRWMEFVADAGSETIPPFALMRLTSEPDPDGTLYMGQPDTDSDTNLFINGPMAVPPLQRGLCTRDTPVFILYDTDDGTPDFLGGWGSKSGSWKLRKLETGYVTLGGATDGAVIALAAAGGGSSSPLTVRELDADPTINNVDTLTFDQTNFVVTEEDDGEAKVKTKGLVTTETVVVAVNLQTCTVTTKVLTYVDGLLQTST